MKTMMKSTINAATTTITLLILTTWLSACGKDEQGKQEEKTVHETTVPGGIYGAWIARPHTLPDGTAVQTRLKFKPNEVYIRNHCSFSSTEESYAGLGVSAVIAPGEIRVLESRRNDFTNPQGHKCPASFEAGTIPYRLDGDVLTVTLDGESVVFRRSL